MSSLNATDAIFPRRFNRCYPVAAGGEGVYVYDENGKRYLDACGGAAVVTVGHGVSEVIESIAKQARELAYAHSSQFHTRVGYELAAYLAAKSPDPSGNARVHFTSGGSEATETAIKIVRQYWLACGEPQRYRIISRWQSYHGATLGALALSGNKRRRQAYEPLLPLFDHISACFCYRCPLGLTYPSCELSCARELEEAIAKAGENTVAGFILEPIVGATSGAVPPEGYLRTIREICDNRGILLIADEVMTGVGRTGKYFGVEHWNIVPDVILLGKGLASGYAPLGAVLVTEKVWQAIERGVGSIDHGFTYQGHPPSLAAGLAVQRYVERHNLVRRAEQQGNYLTRSLERLRTLSCVGDVRGKGLLQTVEFVAGKDLRTPFPPELKFSERLFEQLRERGVLVYPMQGTADGVGGDHILIAPPFVISETEIDFLITQLEAAVTDVAQNVGAGKSV